MSHPYAENDQPPPYHGSTPSHGFNDTKSSPDDLESNKTIQPPQELYNPRENIYITTTPGVQQQQQPTVVVVANQLESKPPPPRGCFASFWSWVLKPAAWASCFYFLIVSPVIGFFAAFWIAGTFLGAILSLTFPPFGYFFCVGTAWSWRALARLELVTVEMCTRPRSFFSCSVYRYQDRQLPPPIFSVTRSPLVQRSCISYGIGICFDRFTWLSFVYFVFIKFFLCMVTFTVTLVLVCTGFTVMLFLLPVLCIVCAKMGEWQVLLAKNVLLP